MAICELNFSKVNKIDELAFFLCSIMVQYYSSWRNSVHVGIRFFDLIIKLQRERGRERTRIVSCPSLLSMVKARLFLISNLQTERISSTYLWVVTAEGSVSSIWHHKIIWDENLGKGIVRLSIVEQLKKRGPSLSQSFGWNFAQVVAYQLQARIKYYKIDIPCRYFDQCKELMYQGVMHRIGQQNEHEKWRA